MTLGNSSGFSEGNWNSLRSPRTSVLRPSLCRLSFSSLLSRKIEPNREIGKTTLPGCSMTKPGTSMRMPISMSVPMSVAVSAVTSSLRFCKIGLGLRVGTTLAAVWKACNSFSRSQMAFIDGCTFLMGYFLINYIWVDVFCKLNCLCSKNCAKLYQPFSGHCITYIIFILYKAVVLVRDRKIDDN